MDVRDAERFNKQASYQDLLLENQELRALIRAFIRWCEAPPLTVAADTELFDGFLTKFKTATHSKPHREPRPRQIQHR
jgi:hypothetical protein